MSRLVVEIHVPLTPAADVADGEDEYPWIDEVEEHLAGLAAVDELEVSDDGEELNGEYLFFISGRPEQQLLQGASRVATRDGVPSETYAVINTGGDMGTGRRVDLPV